jgi:lipopolysaccharide transport system ATP-binding protein
MNDIAIRVENLSKQYRIGRAQQRHDTLRDALVDVLSRIPRLRSGQVGRIARKENSDNSWQKDRIWALKDVSFEVKRGEVVGIIGRNGAGKSTLLKLLSRITEPTEGRAEIWGRVGSLLEVGTGFHPELTGRENIYLSGAILGMRRAEIDRRFDEIVEFSGVEKFIDTPIKRYSSGMKVRLGFAVAAHLEPEILLVDEVLAVGDAEFQKKCLGKMGDVAGEGRTVLFVSHNMASVRQLCQRGVILTEGVMAMDGSAQDAIAGYLRMLETASTANLENRTERRGAGRVRLTGVRVCNPVSQQSSTVSSGDPARFIFDTSDSLGNTSCAFTVYNSLGHRVAFFDSGEPGSEDTASTASGNVFVCDLDHLLLTPGTYRINVAILLNGELQDHVEGALRFDVEAGLLGGRRVARTNWVDIAVPHRWSVPKSARG